MLLTYHTVKPLCDAFFSPYEACRYSTDANTIYVLDEHNVFRQVLHILTAHPKKYDLIFYGTDSEFTPHYLECVRPYVNHIWAQNCRIMNEDALITKIPIGFPIDADPTPYKEKSTSTPKNILCYLPKLGLYDDNNMHHLPARVLRQECIKYFKNNKPFVEIEDATIPREQFYDKLCRCKFVVCPMGVGLDTYRVFEASYMGATPIVLRSTGMCDLYEKFGALIVDKWEDINEDLLQNHVHFHPPHEMFELEFWLFTNKRK